MTRTGRLTDRQLQVLSFMSHGFTHGQIAARMQIEVTTVRNHAHSILIDVVRAAAVYVDADEADGGYWSDVARRTWARQLETCPMHLAFVDDCAECHCFRAGEGPWWDWSISTGQPSDSNRGRPGYFPVTVIDLEG